MPNTEIESIKRTFIVGDEWLYFKFYSGAKTREALLKNIILPVTQNLCNRKIIDRWFFIRYADPEIHARVRFHYTNPTHLNEIIGAINNAVKDYIEKKLVWKVQIDTYQREIERYGQTSMLLSEEYFWHDSVMVVNVAKHLDNDDDEILRWQFGLKSIDVLLNDFHYDLNEKLEILKKLRSGYGRDFGIDSSKVLRKQLSNKYRDNQDIINSILGTYNESDSKLSILFEHVNQRSIRTKGIVENILKLLQKNLLTLTLDQLLMSYIHMTCNRLFVSKQRLNELALYDLLVRYYKSRKARS